MAKSSFTGLMTHSLLGQVALITGSNTGVGKAVLLQLAKEGAICIVNYRAHKAVAEKTLKEIRKYSPKSIVIQADVTKPAQVRAMMQKISQKFGRLDILMNNVGNFVFKPIHQWTDPDFEDVFASNVFAVWYVTHAALPLMKKHTFGRIINVGCVSAEKMVIREHTTPYYAAKHAVVALTKHWAAYEKHPGITFNAIMPGILADSVVQPKESKKKHIVPLDEAAAQVVKLIKSKKNGVLVEISRGWKPR